MEDDDTGVCIAIPHAVNVPYQDLFSYLHNGKTDYIYIETIKDNKLTTGLLCTDKDRHLSDTDSCFLSEKLMGLYIISQVQNSGNIIMLMLCFWCQFPLWWKRFWQMKFVKKRSLQQPGGQ